MTTTVNLRIQGINKYLEFIKKDKDKLKFVKIQQKTYLENVISNADYEFFKNQLKKDKNMDWYFVVRFLGATGARVSELVQIKVEHVKLGYIDLYTKGGKIRRIYIAKRLQTEATKDSVVKKDENNSHNNIIQNRDVKTSVSSREDDTKKIKTLNESSNAKILVKNQSTIISTPKKNDNSPGAVINDKSTDNSSSVVECNISLNKKKLSNESIDTVKNKSKNVSSEISDFDMALKKLGGNRIVENNSVVEMLYSIEKSLKKLEEDIDSDLLFEDGLTSEYDEEIDGLMYY